MKTSLLLTAALAFSVTASATVLTVSNNPESPAQYTSIQAAIDAASPTDTILISAGYYDSQSVSLAKPLTIIGAGYIGGGIATRTGPVTVTAGSEGSYISGFQVGTIDGLSLNDVSGITLSRISGNITLSSNVHGVIIKHSRISDFSINEAQNVIIRNSYLSGTIKSSHSNTIIFNNNIFRNSKFDDVSNFKISNSIFFGEFTDIVIIPAYPDHIFSNNIAYQCGGLILPNSGGSSSNLNDQDPLFVAPLLLGITIYEADFHLQSGSPGRNAGADGSDLGLYGGWDPMPTTAPLQLQGKPRLPEITEFNILTPTTVPQNGSLNIEVQAIKHD